MTARTRSQPTRGNRSGNKIGGKSSRQPTRNITRWSANKDIALLCALSKECRRDKFRISWDRVAKWIGPNVTGGAIEQHVAKLYSKLKEHRAACEPKRKRRKTSISNDEEDVDGDYVDDEEIWNKGNEAFANVFYDKPDASSMILENDAGPNTGELINHPLLRGSSSAFEQDDDEEEYEGDHQMPMIAGNNFPVSPPDRDQGYDGDVEGQSSFHDGHYILGNQGSSSMMAPYGYGTPSLGGGLSGYTSNYMQQNAMNPNSRHSSPVPPRQIGTPIGINPHSRMNSPALPYGPHSEFLNQPHFQGNFAGAQMQDAGRRHPGNQMNHQIENQRKTTTMAMNRTKNSFMYQGGYPEGSGSPPGFQLQSGQHQMPNPLYSFSNFQGQYNSGNMSPSTYQMYSTSGMPRQNVGMQFEASGYDALANHPSNVGMTSPDVADRSNINIKVERRADGDGNDKGGQENFMSSISAQAGMHEPLRLPRNQMMRQYKGSQHLDPSASSGLAQSNQGHNIRQASTQQPNAGAIDFSGNEDQHQNTGHVEDQAAAKQEYDGNVDESSMFFHQYDNNGEFAEE